MSSAHNHRSLKSQVRQFYQKRPKAERNYCDEIPNKNCDHSWDVAENNCEDRSQYDLGWRTFNRSSWVVARDLSDRRTFRRQNFLARAWPARKAEV